MEVAEALDLISRAVDAGRPASGYLVCGDLKGSCDRLVAGVLAKLFPGAESQITARSHPDVIWLEPQGKSRTIKVSRGPSDDGPGMRDGMVEPISATAFSGGWKVGIVVGADRMQPAAANAFLKTLEEPPPKTMFLLLTDAPDSILPTIISRCQRIDLPLSEGSLTGSGADEIAEVFESSVGNGVYAKSLAATRLAEILDALIDEAEPEDKPVVRKSFFKTIMAFARRWMVEGRLPAHVAYRNVEAVEAAFRQCEKAMNAEAALSLMMDRIVFP